MSTLDAAIDRNRTALLRLLAVLFSVMRIEPGDVLETIPKHLQSLVLWVLRPAEAAARRLVVLRAQGLVLPEAKPRAKSSKRPESAETRERAVSFELFDPLRSFDNPTRNPAIPRGTGRRLRFSASTITCIIRRHQSPSLCPKTWSAGYISAGG